MMRGPFSIPPELYDAPPPKVRAPSWGTVAIDPTILLYYAECLILLPVVWLIVTTFDLVQLDARRACKRVRGAGG